MYRLSNPRIYRTNPEVGIYKRKILRKKEGKHAFDQEKSKIKNIKHVFDQEKEKENTILTKK